MAKDRTAEFHNTLLSIKSRTAQPNGKKDESKQSLLGNQASGSSSQAGKGKGKAKDESAISKGSEFGRMAGGIAKDINATTLKLQKLAQRELQLHLGWDIADLCVSHSISLVYLDHLYHNHGLLFRYLFRHCATLTHAPKYSGQAKDIVRR